LRGLPPRRAEFDPWAGHVGFVVGKAALGKALLKYFDFPCLSFHLLFDTYHLTSGATTMGQLVSDVPNGPSLIPL
jgi:hypothetical protein